MMKVMNNGSAMLALGELKKNQSSLEKQLKKVASGMKINNAGDGASEYSISEKMRVRIRCLNQNDENVKTGINLLQVAEGGVQNQLNILRTIKEKVINAHNDTNTDVDRATIQKEIDQSYDQMEAITQETDYNRRRLLVGGTYYETVFSWDKLDSATLVENSDSMAVIADNYQTLDGLDGPFDVFKEWGNYSSSLSMLNLAATQKFSGATEGTPAVFTVDFSNYSSVSDLNEVGFNFGGHTYVLTTDTSKNYTGNPTKIDISDCLTVGDVVSRMGTISNYSLTASATGNILTLTTTAKAASANNTTVQGYSRSQNTTQPTSGTPAVAGTGFFSPAKNLTGGAAQIGNPNNTDPDATYVPGTKASLSVNVSGVSADTGITVSGSGTARIKFVSGNSGFDTSTNPITVGVNGSGTTTVAGMTINYSGGTLTFTATSTGTAGNNYRISDGISATSGSSGGTTEGFKAYSGNVQLLEPNATDGSQAEYTINLSNVPATTSSDDLESVISNLSGKGITYNNTTYEFVDSANTMSLTNATKLSGANAIDLNSLRSAVEAGTDIRTALQSLLLSKLNNSSAAGSDVLLKTTAKGTGANNQTLTVREGKLRSYDIDYSAWFASNSGATIPNDLYDKGFRFYCATDAGQWFNIVFTDGSPIEKEKPTSGTDGQDIKSISIDVSEIQSAADLVTAIYEQANPVLTGSDPNYNHHYRVAADAYKGVLTIYDQRAYSVSDRRVYDYQERGAKIADGVFDNVVKSERELLVDDIVIQHTDHSSQNIHVKIPRMTFDHIFGYKPGVDDIKNYSVLEKKARELLLGIPPEEGILDKGINYILDAATLIGAQNKRLEHANDNIITAQENTTASESTIRDADMAKEMAGYTRTHILSKASEAMLAQANQSSSQVLSLLS